MPSAQPTPAIRPMAPAKLRILETADALFTTDGIRTVGIDRLIGESRVTKATFYKHYGSKDRLIRDYMAFRHQREADAIAALEDQRGERVLRAALAYTLEEIGRPGFRGCAFLNAAAEFPDPAHPVREIVREHREWYAELLDAALRDLGHPLPGDAADDLILARDGAMSGAYAGDSIAATTALHRAVERAIAGARVTA